VAVLAALQLQALPGFLGLVSYRQSLLAPMDIILA